LFGGREIAAFDARVEAAIAAEHVVDHEKDQARVEDEQGRAAQRLGVDQIEVGRYHQVAGELAVFLHPYRAHRDLGAAVHVVEQADAQVAGKTLIDQFERRHAPANDSFLRSEVVRARAIGPVPRRRLGLVGFAADALEQGVDFILREEIGAHCRSLNDERSEQHFLDWPVTLLPFAGGIENVVDLSP
jgi:hypothetical protein